MQFDGTTILFVSDVNIRGKRDAAACEQLMRALEVLQPDMLVLGGDYSAGTMLDILNGNPDGENAALVGNFMRSLSRYAAPLGKYAVAGEADESGAQFSDDLTAAGIQLLQDSFATVERQGARMTILGLRDVSENSTPYDQIGKSFRADECVIVLSHNPQAYTRIRMAEAQGGGSWADMVLSGHTLGGQIQLFGRTLQSLNEEESRRISGWYYGDDLPILVSQGLGCHGMKLRLGTRSEVWLITLRRQEQYF